MKISLWIIATDPRIQIPTLVVCGFTTIAAIISLFAGMVLSNVKKKNRQDFELELIRVNMEKDK